MHAMILKEIGHPLDYTELPIPSPGENELLIKLHACGICRTDLHVMDGELKAPKIPIIPGHQIVGTIEQIGAKVTG